MLIVITLWLAFNALIAAAIFTRPLERERRCDRSQVWRRGADRRA